MFEVVIDDRVDLVGKIRLEPDTRKVLYLPAIAVKGDDERLAIGDRGKRGQLRQLFLERVRPSLLW